MPVDDRPEETASPASAAADGPEPHPTAPASPAETPPDRRTARAGRVRRRPPAPRLAETPGPDPATPPDQVRLVVGTIVGPHGVRGEAKLRLATDAPEHLRRVKQVFLGDEARPRRLLGVRFPGDRGQALLRLQGIGTPEAVDALRGAAVRIAGGDARPLEPGEFFLYQLIGLEAVDEAGASLGRVADVMETGAHDVFVVAPPDGGPDILLPNHPEVVLEILPTEGRMVVRPLVYE